MSVRVNRILASSTVTLWFLLGKCGLRKGNLFGGSSNYIVKQRKGIDSLAADY